MRQHWIDTLVPASLGDFEATPEIDLRLSQLALDARDSHAARDELFTLLAAKVRRFAKRFQTWSLGLWEYGDVLQEAWLTFIDTVNRWTPRYVNNAPAGYCYYFLAVYRLWLSQRVSRMLHRGRPAVYSLPEDRDTLPDPDSPEDETIVISLVDRVRSQLGDQAGEMLQLRLAGGKSVTEIAHATGIPRRTAYRRWSTIVEFTRREWLEEREGA